jgi:hypothetical protein
MNTPRSGSPAQSSDAIAVNTPAEARRAVAELKRKGADFVKVYNRLTRDAYFAIIDEARPRNPRRRARTLLPSARARRQQPDRRVSNTSLESQMRVRAMKTNYGPEWRQRTRRWSVICSMTKPHSATVRESVAVCLRRSKRTVLGRCLLSLLTGLLARWMIRSSQTIPACAISVSQRLVGAIFRAGVPMLAGTDAGEPYCFPGFSLHDELALLVESGLSTLAAIQAATRNAAVFMDASDKYGSVAPGKIADLVLLDSDPLQDIHNTTQKSHRSFWRGKSSIARLSTRC